MFLTSSLQRLMPEPHDLISERPDHMHVAWHAVVGAVSTQHCCQPSCLIGNGLLSPNFHLRLNGFEFCSYPLPDRNALHPEIALRVRCTDVRETKKVECLWFGQTLAVSPPSRPDRKSTRLNSS